MVCFYRSEEKADKKPIKADKKPIKEPIKTDKKPIKADGKSIITSKQRKKFDRENLIIKYVKDMALYQIRKHGKF